MVGHRQVQSRRWAAVVGRYRPLARGARGMKPAAQPATVACPLKRAPGRGGRARCGGKRLAWGRAGRRTGHPLRESGRSRASDRSSSNATWPCRAAGAKARRRVSGDAGWNNHRPCKKTGGQPHQGKPLESLPGRYFLVNSMHNRKVRSFLRSAVSRDFPNEFLTDVARSSRNRRCN